MKPVVEHLPSWDYEIQQKVPSQIDPDKEITVVVGWLCPRCKNRHDGKLEQCEDVRCRKCGLKVRKYGAQFICESEGWTS